MSNSVQTLSLTHHLIEWIESKRNWRATFGNITLQDTFLLSHSHDE